jgi:hypothetical protein
MYLAWNFQKRALLPRFVLSDIWHRLKIFGNLEVWMMIMTKLISPLEEILSNKHRVPTEHTADTDIMIARVGRL